MPECCGHSPRQEASPEEWLQSHGQGDAQHRAAGLLEESRPSILALWGNDGKVSHQDAMDCIWLMGQKVMPALWEIGDELGLKSPCERHTLVRLVQTPAA